MAWLLRLLSVVAAANTSLFVAHLEFWYHANLADDDVDNQRCCHRRCMESAPRALDGARQPRLALLLALIINADRLPWRDGSIGLRSGETKAVPEGSRWERQERNVAALECVLLIERMSFPPGFTRHYGCSCPHQAVS